MLETILEFALVLALAGFFVMWAKWEEQKVKTKEERDRRWDEISLRQNAEKENVKLNACLDAEVAYVDELLDDSRALARKLLLTQNKLSAILCPRNDHVWKDGVCVKCGRVQDGT